MSIQVFERKHTEYEKQIIDSISNKIIEEFNFEDDEKFRNLSVQQQYYYLGLIRGMNTVLDIFTQDDFSEVNNALIKFLNSDKSILDK